MDGDHHLVGEAAFFNRPDDAGGGVVAAAKEIGICNRAGSHGFVANAYLVSIPPAAGVGEVECFVQVEIEVGLTGDAKPAVVIFFPDVAAVIFAQRAAVHANCFYGAQLAQLRKVHAERIIRLAGIAVCQCQIFVMIPDFVPERRNFVNDGFVKALRNHPEIVTAANPGSVLHLSCGEGVIRLPVDIVAEDDDLVFWIGQIF